MPRLHSMAVEAGKTLQSLSTTGTACATSAQAQEKPLPASCTSMDLRPGTMALVNLRDCHQVSALLLNLLRTLAMDNVLQSLMSRAYTGLLLAIADKSTLVALQGAAQASTLMRMHRASSWLWETRASTWSLPPTPCAHGYHETAEPLGKMWLPTL